VLVVHNARNDKATVRVNLDGNRHFEANVPAGGIATYTWSAG
jgi:hypothetical protein